jgi:hypothetical protein
LAQSRNSKILYSKTFGYSRSTNSTPSIKKSATRNNVASSDLPHKPEASNAAFQITPISIMHAKASRGNAIAPIDVPVELIITIATSTQSNVVPIVKPVKSSKNKYPSSENVYLMPEFGMRSVVVGQLAVSLSVVGLWVALCLQHFL